MKKILFLTLIIAFALSLTACPPGPTPHTHDWGNWVVTTPATATTPGEETRTCNTCGEKVTRPIPPTGGSHVHEYAATWSKDATQHWHECTANDGAKTDAANHTSGDWIIDQAATATTAGSQHKECTVCGYVIETETIPNTHTHEWEWKVTTPATPTADGLETETCKTCGAESGNIRIIEQTEPTVKTFSVTFNFENGDSGEQLRNAVIKDERTNCGSQNLEQLGIVTVIKEATMGAFTTVATGNQENQKKNMFRTVFGVDGGVTIIVNNPATLYKLKAPDKSTIYFHIDYLKSNPSDIQQITFDALTAMLTGGASLPYNAEYTTPHQTTITAFGKTATVTGDAALSTADFNTAKGKLQEAMTKLSSAITAPSILERYGEVLGRVGFAILIKTGNAGPDADANKSMTIGVDYLLNNDAETTIAQAINKKIYTDNAFAD